MQYIKKSPEPPKDWDKWFTSGNGRRSFDYKADYVNLPNIGFAKKYLLDEQSGLCAYCQSPLTSESASIEHVIPKSQNVPVSTSYHNLVAVCKTPLPPTVKEKSHCDKERGDKILPPIIFYANAQVDYPSKKSHAYFDAYQDGQIVPKPNLPPEIHSLVSAFIEILNLNHSVLMSKRGKGTLDGIIETFTKLKLPRHQMNSYWEVQIERILRDLNQPYRQFLLIYIARYKLKIQ